MLLFETTSLLHIFFLTRFYGQSEDGDEFNNSIRQLFLAFNTLMDRPLEEAVKIKVSLVTLWGTHRGPLVEM